VSLGHRADLVLVAPISANTLAKLAMGIADNLLSVTVLASSAPLIIAPAMDVDMYNQPITQQNVETLRKRGAIIVALKVVTWHQDWLAPDGFQNPLILSTRPGIY
jgi:phosphopantothenoylcysteine decarboxylase/phosphopantothenate--cysteine ligase